MVKIVEGNPTIHAVILGVLLLWRLGRWVIGKFKPAQVAA
jgi:hypothetical protein